MTDKVKAEILNEMDADTPTPDFHPDWKYEKKPVEVFTLRNGVFNRLAEGTRALEREKKARNGLYTCESADAAYVLINYDRDDARPYVKALIARANKLREVKLLYLALGLLIIQLLVFVGGWIIVGKQIGELSKIIPMAARSESAPVKISNAEASAVFSETEKPVQEKGKFDNLKIQ